MKDHVAPADLRALNALLPELYRLRDLAALPAVMLQIVADLIPNLFCTYNELNLRTGAVVAVYHPQAWQPRMEALMPRLVPHLAQHPVYRHVTTTGDGAPRAISDFLPLHDWLATDFGRELSSLGVTEDLIFCIHVSDRMLIFIAVNRAQPDFSGRDRAIAELLRQHFSIAHENGAAFTQSQALAALTSEDIEASPQALALVEKTGRLLHLNSKALEMLEQSFPAEQSWTTELPQPIRIWLRATAESPLDTPRTFDWPGSSAPLEVRSADAGDNQQVLLFRWREPSVTATTRAQQAGLTKREAEVLQWAAEGKSNSEIGQILFISPRTVGKHLEAIYRKLGVESRRAAMLWVHHSDGAQQRA